jgi:excisionase family DNA binding protein
MRDNQTLDHWARCGGTASSGPPRGCGPVEALTLTQVSEELNVSRAHVYRLVRRGELTAIQVGCRRAWLVERAMLEEFITDAYRRTAEITDAYRRTAEITDAYRRTAEITDAYRRTGAGAPADGSVTGTADRPLTSLPATRWHAVATTRRSPGPPS